MLDLPTTRLPPALRSGRRRPTPDGLALGLQQQNLDYLCSVFCRERQKSGLLGAVFRRGFEGCSDCNEDNGGASHIEFPHARQSEGDLLQATRKELLPSAIRKRLSVVSRFFRFIDNFWKVENLTRFFGQAL